MPQQSPDQAFSFDLEIRGLGQNPEEIRKLLNQRLGLLAMQLAAENGFEVTGIRLTHTASTPEVQPAPVDAMPGSEENAAPEATPEVSFFDAETQASLDTTIAGNFLTKRRIKYLNGETDDDEKNRNIYQAVAEKVQNDDLAVISDERQRAFVDALAESGVRTVRDALILGMTQVRDEVDHLLPNQLKRRSFRREVETLVQGIVDIIPENVYDEFTTPEVLPSPEDKDKGEEQPKGKVLLDAPLSLEQIARICNHPSQVPALAVKTAAVQNFGHFPEAWNSYTLADLINPGAHAELIRSATAELKADQAQRCLDAARQFAGQLAQLTADATR